MKKPVLIVGVDPGATVGYALLDIKGNIVDIQSGKSFDLSSLIKEITAKGYPAVVGTDKKNIPHFVNDFATKVGARLVSPEEDLKVAEKQEIVKIKTRNDHEKDALASALFAFKKLRQLITKAHFMLEKANLLEIEQEVVKLVLTKEGIPIRLAIELITKPDEPEVKIIKEAIEKKELSKEYFEMYERLRMKERENEFLSRQNKKLKHIIQDEKAQYMSMLKSISRKAGGEKENDLLLFKDQQINRMDSIIKEKDCHINKLKEDIDELNNLLLDIDEFVLVKKLDNLGSDYKNKKNILNIKENDILYVKDCSIISKDNIDELKRKVHVIICSKPTKTISDNFIVLDKEKINMIESKHIAFCDRQLINEMIDKKSMFCKIVREYKEERKEV